VTGEGSSALLTEASGIDTPEERLLQLVRQSDTEVSEAALGNLIRRKGGGNLAQQLSASRPEDVLRTTIAALCDVLGQLPAVVASRSQDSLRSSLKSAGFVTTLVCDLFIACIDEIVRSRGPDVEAAARALAVNFPGTITDLLDTTELAIRGQSNG
jgi:hypothetical protein